MLQRIRVSMLAAISTGLLLGFGVASLQSAKKSEQPAAAESAIPASIPFVDNSGICCPDDVGCYKDAGRAAVLTMTTTNTAAQTKQP